MRALTGKSRWLAGLALMLVAFTVAAAPTPAARVQDLEGTAYAVSTGGERRLLHGGDSLFEGERVITARKSAATLSFIDDTRLVLAASTIITIDSFKYRAPGADAGNADEAEDSLSATFITGAVRALTGFLAKRRPRNVLFRTAVATIGIRGTHFVAEVSGDSATIILLAQEDTAASNAIEVSNQYGKVEVDKPGWGTEVPDATSPPSQPRPMRTTNSMNRIVRSINTTRRVITPRPRMP